MNSRDGNPRSVALVLVLIVGLGLGLRLLGLNSQSLSNDEVLDWQVSLQPADEILIEGDGFPPLYYLILKAWNRIFKGELSPRFLSVSLGTATLIALWYYSATELPQALALWPVFFLAISPFHIFHSQEGRPYSLYYLASVVTLTLFGNARRRDSTVSWLLFGVSCGVGLLVHYYFVFLIATMGIIQLVDFGSQKRFRRRVLPLVFAMICCLPALMALLPDLQFQSGMSSQTPFDIYAFGYSLFVFVAGYSLGPSTRDLHTLDPNVAIIQFLPWILILIFPICYLLYTFLKTESRNFGRSARTLSVLWILPILFGGIASSLSSVGFKTQYVLISSPPLLVLIGMCAGISWRRSLGRVCVLTIALVSLLSVHNRITDDRYRTEDIREVAALLNQVAGDDEPVFVTAGYMADVLKHYLSGESGAVLPLSNVPDFGLKLDRVVKDVEGEINARQNVFWLVYSRPFHGDPKGVLLEALLDKGLITHYATFAGVDLFHGISPDTS